MTFSPLILQKVYKSRQIAFDNGVKSFVFVEGCFCGGARRKARKASAMVGTSWSRWGSSS